jgi:hypothetical protein
LNPLAVLQERYPSADFSIYFRHLAACQVVKGPNTQDHHICPRKQFPEFATGFSENLITLSIEDHAWAHKLLEAACGIKSPPTAYFEAQKECSVNGGRASGLKNKRNRTGICGLSLEQRQEAGRLGAAAQSREGHQAGGHAAGCKSRDNGTGIFGLTAEHKSDACRKGALARTPAQQLKAAQAGAQKMKKLWESGVGIGVCALTLEERQEAGRKGALISQHKRWHIKRGIVNLLCALCKQSESELCLS